MTDKREQDAAYKAFVNRLESGLAGCDPRFIFDAGYRAALTRPASGDAVEAAITEFNALGKTEEFYGQTNRVYARKPILATDCDYEIVRISGVQGVKL